MRIVKHNNAFTVVELLIVVVLISILATITIVTYNGIISSADKSAAINDLNQASKKLEVYKVASEGYPTGGLESVFNAIGYSASEGTEYRYSADASSYCLEATRNIRTFYITNTVGSPQEGFCFDDMATTMQTLTPNQCEALPTYNGSNEEAVIFLTDNRGGTERIYQVAKLADNNCWMLDNLKLGSTSETITLTPSDSNVGSNFTLPQLTNSPSGDYDTPKAYGPVPGDTGTGTTNYGFLYNWSAATAGESRTSHPAGTGNAQYSICPSGWRLPTGGTAGEFAMLNAKMYNPSASSPSLNGGSGFYINWHNTGPFKGVFSGYILTVMLQQNSLAYLWSSSSSTNQDNNALYARFSATETSPGNLDNVRSFGFAVRCLLS